VSFTVDTGVRVPMRDGVELDTSIWRPVGAGPWPVSLVRTRYGKDLPGLLGDATAARRPAIAAAHQVSAAPAETRNSKLPAPTVLVRVRITEAASS
jgi:predicted acyl esterase